jgi:hypothetical protein
MSRRNVQWCYLIVFLLVSPSLLAKSYTTDFNGDEQPLSESGVWSNIGKDWTSVVKKDGVAFGTHHATGYNDSYAVLSGFGPDQRVAGTIFITGKFSANQEIELLLRWTQSAHHASGYEILWDARNAYGYIVRWNGALGDFTKLQRLNFPRPARTGDLMSAQILGKHITVYLNGKLVGGVTDSMWGTGNPGIGFFSEDPSGKQNGRFGFTRFTATDEVTPAGMTR